MGGTGLTLQDEQALIERARAGDGDAFGALYDAFREALYATVIYPRLRDPDAALDVLQETFLLALRKIGTFRWRDRSIFFWLRMIAVNKVRERLHAQRHATVDDSVLAYLPDNTWQPDTAVMLKEYQSELKQGIEKTLAALNERYRAVIEMRLLKQMSREDCAKALGTTIETFDVVFFRACRAFREAYVKMFG